MSEFDKEDSQPEKALHEQLVDPNKSSIQRYKELALGTDSWWYLIKYEFIILTSSWVPGALGLVLRKKLYPFILKEVGSNTIFGRGVTIRHGQKICLGDNVVLDDDVLLDAKGSSNSGIAIGSNTIISRNVVLSCKNGSISIGTGCTIGINSIVHAMRGSDVTIGDDVLVGAFCYFIGSGPYVSKELDTPFKKQGMTPQGGICVANNVWLGSNVQVLDGIRIDTGSIIGTSAVVNKDVGAYSVTAGIPAKELRSRIHDV